MPCLTRTPSNVAVTLLPIDQLSSGVCAVMPSPYRSAMRRPLHDTTKAAVIPAAGSKAASTACFTLGASSSDGGGSLGRASPMGHSCLEGSGRRLLSLIGAKFTEFLPTGSVTHPWSPRYLAVRVTPFGSAMSASRLETVACGGAWAAAFTAGVSAWCPKAAVQTTVSASVVAIACVLIPYLPPRDETRPAYM